MTETRQKEVSGDVDVGTRMLVRCVGIGESVPRPEDVGQEPYSILIYIYIILLYTHMIHTYIQYLIFLHHSTTFC